MTITGFAALATLVSGSAHIYTDSYGPRGLTYLFKPLTMLIIIGLLVSQTGISSQYQLLILCGLVFSLAGDCFLMLPTKPLLPGLGSFLIAHFFYVAAFSSIADIQWSTASYLVLAVIILWCAIIWLKLHTYLGKLYIPGTVYFLSISIMVFLATNQYLNNIAGGAWLVTGALLFYISDTALAFNRIKAPYNGAQPLILSTYFSAQFLIVYSVITGGH